MAHSAWRAEEVNAEVPAWFNFNCTANCFHMREGCYQGIYMRDSPNPHTYGSTQREPSVHSPGTLRTVSRRSGCSSPRMVPEQQQDKQRLVLSTKTKREMWRKNAGCNRRLQKAYFWLSRGCGLTADTRKKEGVLEHAGMRVTVKGYCWAMNENESPLVPEERQQLGMGGMGGFLSLSEEPPHLINGSSRK
eukprot:1158655-Pelagomonas_calceolata.AAC.8